MFDSRRYHIFLEAVSLERGPLSLVRINEERVQVYKTEINGRGGPLRWPRDTSARVGINFVDMQR
jgi:hypothetical protein